MRNVSYNHGHLNMWSPVGDTVGVVLGGAGLLGKVFTQSRL